jgi:hypothetical protein
MSDPDVVPLTESRVVVRDDYGGSGRVTQVIVNDTIAWTWAWHIDGRPSVDAAELLHALRGRHA